MFSKTTLVILCSLSVLAVASPVAPRGNASQCDTGPAQCCNSLQSATDPSATELAGLLGIVLEDVAGQIGLGCTPISVIGLGQGANCAQQPVCCQNNRFSGLINIGCTPISI